MKRTCSWLLRFGALAFLIALVAPPVVVRALEEKLSGAPPLPAYLANQLQRLDTKLNELKDWKSFAKMQSMRLINQASISKT